MTALYPSREDAELNASALALLETDKRNEACCLMDGAWTGHPDQNEIAIDCRARALRRAQSSAIAPITCAAKARACSTVIWKTWRPTASTG